MDKTLSLYMSERQSQIIRDAVSNESPRLFRFIRGKVATDEDAQDILQDVFYQLSNNSAIAESIENMAAWLFRVARNRIIDTYRKKKPETFDSSGIGTEEDEGGSYLSQIGAISADTNDDPDALYERNLVWETLYEALTELPEEQRNVFELHELENKSFQEISELTGVGINTLLSRKRYAVLHLRKKMQQLYNEMLNN
ncbi:MAG: RNA polymerase sigma factor [Chitinophagales bacterium]|nr:RNA polymerase sigma factor [Chitinophagales bacterium]MBP8755059.1 RNA polymerase sigma factor [Chitinophagales bacterium]MBP9190375.1 RNA polymerase sigma factor [Chitinophagales bacterium]MBP9549819.1 RNA polymerase sigma factor [Chitinophagales bacterium]MBP9705684.1 RNA polymerase sigma factor [Chitinophagales bacterium]